MRRIAPALGALLATLIAAPAQPFTISSGFSHGCHEEITLNAFEDFFLEEPVHDVPVSEGTTWRELALFFRDTFPQLVGTDLDPLTLDDGRRFRLVSLLVGVRSPDTDGHSVLNIDNLRLLHGDPNPQGQYAHALRGPLDDLQGGNAVAVEGTREAIRELVRLAIAAELEPDELVRSERFYLDFYGVIEVDVYVPMFLLGRAVHALQDSFSHNIRDESADPKFSRIVHVLNYVDAIGTNFDETRDGLAHSDSMDDCLGDAEPIAEAAREATADLFFAHRAARKGLDPNAVETVLDKWITLREGGVIEDGFCNNQRWVEVVRQKQTEPYFKAIFGCSSGTGPSETLPVLAPILLALLTLRVSRNRASRRAS